MLPPCKNDLKCRILIKVSNSSYFTSPWLTSDFLLFVFVSITAFEISPVKRFSLICITARMPWREFLEPVEISFRQLYYLYTKFSKKFGELKCLYKDLKDQFEMYGGEVKPVKSNDIRCFAMIRVV